MEMFDLLFRPSSLVLVSSFCTVLHMSIFTFIVQVCSPPESASITEKDESDGYKIITRKKGFSHTFYTNNFLNIII